MRLEPASCRPRVTAWLGRWGWARSDRRKALPPLARRTNQLPIHRIEAKKFREAPLWRSVPDRPWLGLAELHLVISRTGTRLRPLESAWSLSMMSTGGCRPRWP